MSLLPNSFRHVSVVARRCIEKRKHNFILRCRFSGRADDAKVTPIKSDAVKLHHVNHFSVEKTPITAQLWSQRHKKRDITVASTDTYESIAIETLFLLDKTAKESRLTIRYNFSRDAHLRDLYVDAFGYCLTGKLFEDLDALAGNVAFSHCDHNNPLSRPLSLVTARVDRIRQSKKISASDDLILTGQVVSLGLGLRTG
jgi:hypothetical protein